MVAAIGSADTMDTIGELSLGELIVDNFALDAASGAFVGTTAADIDVSASTGAGGVTLLFSRTDGTDLTLPAGQFSGALDISYRLAVAPGSQTSRDLGAARALLGATSVSGASGLVSVAADLADTSGGALGDLNLLAGMVNDPDAVTFLPLGNDVALVSVQVQLLSADPTLGATLADFSQTYATQAAAPVPEPAALAMLAVGGAGLLRYRRRNIPLQR
jgi:hypothetical protein